MTGSTNLKRPRTYEQSPAGLNALRQSVRRTKPWLHSTGPKTAQGKARSRMNALTHGERAAKTIATRQEVALLLKTLRNGPIGIGDR